MKITTDTPDLLILDDRPILLGIVLVLFILLFVGIGLAITFSGELLGLIFALLGGGLGFGAFAVFVRRVQLVFHRPEGWAEIRRRSLFGGTKLRHRLAEITRAEVEERSSSDGGPVWRVVLVIDEGQSAGRHPVTQAFSNGNSHHRCAEAINRWLGMARSDAPASLRG